MKSYQYIARDISGTRKTGHGQAACANDMLNWIREQQLTPVSLNEIDVEANHRSRTLRHTKRIKAADLSAFCWQLTTMVEGGIPISAAMETIAEDIDNKHFEEILRTLSSEMEKGETFADSIGQFPKVFNKLSHAIILAGETSGSLPESLKRVAEYYDNKDKLGKKIKGAMAYPIFVLVFIVMIVTFVMTFIVPRFEIIFEQFGGELPAFTKAFMGVYELLRDNVLNIIGGTLAIIIGSIVLSKTSWGHRLFAKIILAFPLLGKIVAQGFIATFCRTMSTLLGAGVSVLDVFNILSGMTNNDTIKDSVTKTRESIIAGDGISSSLAKAGFFPNMVVKMVQVGEESGSLTVVLSRTAGYYERKVDSTINTVMSLLEPIMIVTVGAIVLAVVLALYLPIFSMGGT